MANVKRTDAERAAAKAARDAQKQEAFKKLAVARTNKAIAAIRQLEALSNTNSYLYTEEQAQAVVKALESAVVKVAGKFAAPNAKVEGEFTL